MKLRDRLTEAEFAEGRPLGDRCAAPVPGGCLRPREDGRRRYCHAHRKRLQNHDFNPIVLRTPIGAAARGRLGSTLFENTVRPGYVERARLLVEWRDRR